MSGFHSLPHPKWPNFMPILELPHSPSQTLKFHTDSSAFWLCMPGCPRVFEANILQTLWFFLKPAFTGETSSFAAYVILTNFSNIIMSVSFSKTLQCFCFWMKSNLKNGQFRAFTVCPQALSLPPPSSNRHSCTSDFL